MARKPLTPEQLQKRVQQAFSRRIQTTFKNAGFVFVPTGGKERKFGLKTGELDGVFLYENIVIVCEETIKKDARDHLKNKKLLFEQIAANKSDLIEWLKADFPERFATFDDYDTARYKVYFLYFSRSDLPMTEADEKLFSPTIVVQPATLNYFHKMAQNIKRSSRTDIFRYLGVKTSDLGSADSGAGSKKITTTIIYPTDNTGLTNGVRVVSFMMSADMLLRNAYVLRKDNWQQSIELYQRLIERERIQSIRRYLADRKSTFINNIIVSLPDGVQFQDANNNIVALESLTSFDGHSMLVPDEMNSICVIDGQHRIYAHYEGIDGMEQQIASLRKKFHLLVTGLIFPPSMTELERRKFESEIFLDINSNARPVPADVLLFIETLKDPFSDLGVARQVLERLNAGFPFENKFQLSLMDDGKIKIASIIKFALRYLVEITADKDRATLFHYWSTSSDREALLKKKDGTLLASYVTFAASSLTLYFKAIQSVFKDDWTSETSRILSTTSINGFLIALRRSLPTHGLQDSQFYRSAIAKANIDFEKGAFPYASSQYGKFARMLADQAFGVVDEESNADDNQED